MKKPYIIDFKKIGNTDLGFLVAIEAMKEIPFAIKRTYYTFDIPDATVRGHHAHKVTEQVLICLKGRISVKILNTNQEQSIFELNDASNGLYLPPDVWHTMTYYDNAIQLVIASENYDEADYIRDFNHFIK